MPRAVPPSVLLKFQGRRDWPLQDGIDDWGLNPEQQESYVEQFRRILEAKKAWREDVHDYFTLRRFLRARSYDLEKATTMWLNHINWQKEFSVETILKDFYFQERDAFVEAYPQGYHKLDKMGRPIYIQQLGKINIAKLKKICSEDRMLKYHIQEYERCRRVILPICSRLAGRHLDQTFGIMDVSGVGLSHLTGEVKRLMTLVTKYDQDNYPEMLGHICIINAPAVFRMIWGFAKGLIDPRTQSKIEILGPNYKEAVLKWVDEENLPDWLGGTSKGSLIDDIGPWSDPELCARIGVNVDELRSGSQLPPLPSMMRQVSERLSITSSKRGSGHFAQAHPSHLIAAPKHGSGRSDGHPSPPVSADLQAVASRRISGVPLEVVDEAAHRYQVSVSGHSAEAQAGPPGFPLKPRVNTLIERIAALERLVPPHMARLKNDMQPTANGNTVAASTRSAPEGSLLNRVEVLEEALDALLVAQEAALDAVQQQQQLQLQALQQKPPVESSCCCVVM